MSPWLYWPIFGLMVVAFLLIVGLSQFVFWAAVVELYTAWRARRLTGASIVFPSREALEEALDRDIYRDAWGLRSKLAELPPVW